MRLGLKEQHKPTKEQQEKKIEFKPKSELKKLKNCKMPEHSSKFREKGDYNNKLRLRKLNLMQQ